MNALIAYCDVFIILFILYFNFKIEHRAGIKHGNADALSRTTCDPLECSCYDGLTLLRDLPCGGCNTCLKKHQQWSTFTEESEVLPIHIGINRVNREDKPNSCCVSKIIQFILSVTGILFFLKFGFKFTKCASGVTNVGIRRLRTREVDEIVVPDVQNTEKYYLGGRSADEKSETSLKVKSDWIGGYTPGEMSKRQLEDPNIGIILRSKLNGNIRPDREAITTASPATRNLWLMWQSLVLYDGVLYLKRRLGTQCERWQLVLPSVLIPRVIKACHNSLLSAHLGVKKTISKIESCFCWYGMKVDVTNWIKQCEFCGGRKRPSRKPFGKLRKYIAGAPLDRIATDILGPFPVTECGNKYILVVMDQFTKFVEVYALSDQTAETVARKIVFEFISRYGVPLELHSDQGKNFESNLFKEICRLLEIHKTRTTAFHPASNGMVERFNHTLVNMICTYVNENQDNWDQYLNFVTSAYRACQHESTGFTPNMLMFGREVNMPIALELGIRSEDENCTVEFVCQLRERLHEIYEKVRESLGNSFKRQSKNHDSRISKHSFAPGDLVYTLDSTRIIGRSPKLKTAVWKGPHVIMEKINDLLYLVRFSPKKVPKVTHYERLKLYTSVSVPEWVANVRKDLTGNVFPAVETIKKKTVIKEAKKSSKSPEHGLLRRGDRQRRPPKRFGQD